MKDYVHDQVTEYLYTFYSKKDEYVLFSELKKLIINNDESYKLDIIYIERILESRGFQSDIEYIRKDISENKLAYQIAYLIKSLKSYFLFQKNTTTPLIENIEYLDINLIEKIFDKVNLNLTQAEYYNRAIITVKRNIPVV